MNRKLLGTIAAAAVANVLAQSPAFAADKEPAKSKAKTVAVGKCVHNCAGYAACKGNGNNSCKGKNDCANQGLVPKACSSQASEDACKKVLDPKKNTMCSWFTE